MQIKQQVTIQEFDEFVSRPENADRLFEYINGEIIEVVSNNYSSIIAQNISTELGIFIKTKGLGWLTGADGGYKVAGQDCIPDAAFISFARQPKPSTDTYNPKHPDLAVEVLSPYDKPAKVKEKIEYYIQAGVLLWLVDPDRREIDVYEPNQDKRTLTESDTLEGGEVLKGFKLRLRDIFPQM